MALLMLAPNWKLTDKIVHSLFYPLLLGAVYTGGMIMAAMGHGAQGGGFSSIQGVRTLFSADVGMIIGWTHYLVFDLFIGAWEARDARRNGFNHWLLIPCLLLTFMAGPIGLALYLILRKVTGKGGWNLGEG